MISGLINGLKKWQYIRSRTSLRHCFYKLLQLYYRPSLIPLKLLVMRIVEVNGVAKAFAQHKVLSDISFVVEKGSFTALLGKNGSGKSTILNILMGQERLDKGTCLLFGENIQDDPAHLKNKIGYVSEKIRLDHPQSIEKYIDGFGKLFDQYDYDYFKAMAKEVKIDLSKQFGAYSRGQKMQIVLMSALAHHPELILVDEITSVLDAFARSFFIDELKEMTKKGGTVIITTNIVNEVQFYCTDVIFLSDSKVKFQTPLAEIPSNFKKIRPHLTDHPIFKSENCIWSGINSDGSQSYILSKEAYAGMDLKGILEDKRIVTLEDLFIFYSQSDKR